MTDRRSVVLVTVDSLRADRCGFLGARSGLTPALDALAETGVVYENAIAPAGSTPGSTATFLTGEYPVERHPDQRDTIVDHLRARPTLAERFASKGYETAAVVANPRASSHFGFDAGFATFEDFLGETATGRFDRRVGPLRAHLDRMRNWAAGQEVFMTWESIYPAIAERLDALAEPYFLWIFLVDVHMPYIPPAAFRSRSLAMTYAANGWLYAGAPDRYRRLFAPALIQAYDDTVRYTDAFVERLLDDLGGDPVVCVHADHGELLGERGRWGHGALYEPVVHVPLVLGNVDPDRIRRPVTLAALPSLLLGAAAEGPPAVDADFVTARNYHGKRLVRGADWRYLASNGTEEVAVRVHDRGWEVRPEHPLAEIGRTVVEHAARTDRERRRIVDVAETVTAE